MTGATYGLIAMGFALIYKSTGVVNFAQGELVMLTAYVSFSLANALGLSFFPLLAVTIPISMAIGLVLERLFIRPMLGEPVFSIVMATVGLAVVLRGIVVLIWGSEPLNFAGRTADQRDLDRRRAVLSGAALFDRRAGAGDAVRLAVPAVHRLGMAMRAVAANETAALLMGVSVDRIHASAWMLSAGIAPSPASCSRSIQARAGSVVPGAQIVSRR